MMTPLFCNVERRLSVVVLHHWVGPGAQEQSHALALVLDDAVVERGVALAGLLVQTPGVLDQEIHDVQGVTRLVADGMVQARLGKLLQEGQGKKNTWSLQPHFDCQNRNDTKEKIKAKT